MKRDEKTKLCDCGCKAYYDETRYSEWEKVLHCPKCEMPCTECSCEDYIPKEKE